MLLPCGAVKRAARLLRKFGRASLLGACLFMAPAAFLPLTPPAQAQNAELDPLTRQVMKDALLQLRFAALALETDDEVGQAMEGLVRAMLARGEMDKALEEAGRIDDSLWLARAYRSIAIHLYENGDINGAKAYLKQASDKVEVEGRLKRASELLRLIAVKQAEFGDLEHAINTTRKIPSVLTRLQAFQDAAEAPRRRRWKTTKPPKRPPPVCCARLSDRPRT